MRSKSLSSFQSHQQKHKNKPCTGISNEEPWSKPTLKKKKETNRHYQDVKELLSTQSAHLRVL